MVWGTPLVLFFEEGEREMEKRKKEKGIKE
jgi:hypothetical protein